MRLRYRNHDGLTRPLVRTPLVKDRCAPCIGLLELMLMYRPHQSTSWSSQVKFRVSFPQEPGVRKGVARNCESRFFIRTGLFWAAGCYAVTNVNTIGLQHNA
ncbi:hypothetical protein RRG08_046548 [Elysia crispata]|uniref:Uncharacterized protein n=1 Tax=Elysia crispata TaxID=231223 RepID=A0AAE1DB11_9GAST|nr:hypothetical protein RRG08_046548 [Elysia crispata]